MNVTVYNPVKASNVKKPMLFFCILLNKHTTFNINKKKIKNRFLPFGKSTTKDNTDE